MKDMVKCVASASRKFARRHAKKVKKVLAVLAIAFIVASPASVLATDPPDATTIATGAETAFGVVAPIVITIATFFVVVRIAKRVVK